MPKKKAVVNDPLETQKNLINRWCEIDKEIKELREKIELLGTEQDVISNELRKCQDSDEPKSTKSSKTSKKKETKKVTKKEEKPKKECKKKDKKEKAKKSKAKGSKKVMMLESETASDTDSDTDSDSD